MTLNINTYTCIYTEDHTLLDMGRPEVDSGRVIATTLNSADTNPKGGPSGDLTCLADSVHLTLSDSWPHAGHSSCIHRQQAVRRVSDRARLSILSPEFETDTHDSRGSLQDQSFCATHHPPPSP